MKTRIFKWAVYILMGLPFYLTTTSYSTGITGVSQDGCSCHGNENTNTTVNITYPAGSYDPGQWIDFTITVANPNMTTAISAGGFNLMVNTGTLQSIDASTQVIGSELTHTTPKKSSTGSVSWDFKYLVPATGGPLLFTVAGNAVDGGGGNANDQWNFGDILPVALPVTFNSFKGRFDGNGVLLDWKVEAMVNASHFEIYRSLDGKLFNAIATIAIDHNKSYKYFDPTTFSGQNYYQIKAIDFDGQVTKSKIITVAQVELNKIKLYPTIVVNGKLMVSSSNDEYDLTAAFYDLNGSLVARHQLASTSIDVSALTKGIYIVKIDDGGQVSTAQKIMIH